MAKAKEVLETVEKDVEKVIDKVKVELADLKEGIHTVFTKNGSVEFKDGVAEVSKEVATEVKETGLVK